MAKQDIVLDASARTDVGKGASRRLRRLEGNIPGIVYGAGKDPVSITIRHDDIFHATENEAFFSSIIELNLDGTTENVVIKDLQRHPAKPRIMHADFLRVRADVALTVNVPLHLVNENSCVGVKLENGQIITSMNELQVSCLPKDLPEYIEVDMADVHTGDIVHISDLKLPEGVTSVDLSHGEEHDYAVVSVTEIRARAVEEPEVGAAEGEAAEGAAPAADQGGADDSAGDDSSE
jgi:large subunit ribosomal protein L25